MSCSGVLSEEMVMSVGDDLLSAELFPSELIEDCPTPIVQCECTPTMDDVPICDFFFEYPSKDVFADVVTQWLPPLENMQFQTNWVPAMDSAEFVTCWGPAMEPVVAFGLPPPMEEVAPMDCPPSFTCLAASQAPRMVVSLADALGTSAPTMPLPTNAAQLVEEDARAGVRHGSESAHQQQTGAADGTVVARQAAPAPSAPPAAPAPGSPELPSVGSTGHLSGRCSPCAFFHSRTCANGPMCQFCHLCPPEERKRQKKAKEAKLADRKAAVKSRSVAKGAAP